MFIPNHLHLIVKGTFKTPPTKVEELNKWFTELVSKVRMKVVAGPTSVYVSEEGNEGLTGTVTLATSHASMHVWEKYKEPLFQFDIYSCSEFSAQEVLDHLNQFNLINYEFLLIDRNGKMKVIEAVTN